MSCENAKLVHITPMSRLGFVVDISIFTMENHHFYEANQLFLGFMVDISILLPMV